MMSYGAFAFWMVFPFVWGGIGVLIILVACVRELVHVARTGRDVLYNSAAFLDEEGKFLGAYRKVHLFAGEKSWFRPGCGYRLFSTRLGKIGIFICWDAAFPEPARIYAVQGAYLLVVATNYEKPYAADWDLMTAARAFDNTLHLVAANRFGRDKEYDFFGHSRILDPLGRVISKLDEEVEGFVTGEIDPGLTVRLEQARLPVFTGLYTPAVGGPTPASPESLFRKTTTLVPLPGRELTFSSPPIDSTRSRIVVNPNPPGASERVACRQSNPLPSSDTSIRTVPPFSLRSMSTRVARACRAAFVSASWVTRRSWISAVADRRGMRSYPRTRVARPVLRANCSAHQRKAAYSPKSSSTGGRSSSVRPRIREPSSSTVCWHSSRRSSCCSLRLLSATRDAILCRFMLSAVKAVPAWSCSSRERRRRSASSLSRSLAVKLFSWTFWRETESRSRHWAKPPARAKASRRADWMRLSDQ